MNQKFFVYGFSNLFFQLGFIGKIQNSDATITLLPHLLRVRSHLGSSAALPLRIFCTVYILINARSLASTPRLRTRKQQRCVSRAVALDVSHAVLESSNLEEKCPDSGQSILRYKNVQIIEAVRLIL